MLSMLRSPLIPLAKHKAGILLAISFFILVAGLYEQLMAWVVVLNFCAVTVRASLFLGWYKHIPEVRTINLLSILTAIALAWLGIEQGLLNSMVNLLACACSLKLMIMRQQKDYLQLFLSLVFLAGTGFIFKQDIAFLLLYVCVLALLLLSLSLQYSSRLSLRHQSVFLLRFALQALPIAAIFFIVFPQLPPLWLMPSSTQATSGLSDTMRPGDIAKLSQSDELAFRAEFKNNLPEAKNRYWRALVLEHFDGDKWSVSPIRRKAEKHNQLANNPFKLQAKGESIDYRIYTEASNQTWLFSLDVPVPSTSTTASKVWATYTYSLHAKQPLMSPMAYDVRSFYQVKMNQTDANFDVTINLQLPERGNPKTRAWVEKLQKETNTNMELISTILSFFKNQAFAYTLNPPLMQSEGIDSFLFEAQKGFCAHYASAMVFALRLANIPARIVTGYQGGEPLNESVLSVYQYDAHAWVEAWLGADGWVRFDPTAMVAPDRLTMGLQNTLGDEIFFANHPLSLSQYQHITLLKSLRDFIEQADYLWSRWILGFDKQQQQDLFKQLIGKITPQRIAYLMLSVLALIALLLSLFFIPALSRQTVDPVSNHYGKITSIIELQTGVKRGAMAPNEYFSHVNSYLPEKARDMFQHATYLFVANQYQPHSDMSHSECARKLKVIAKQLRRVCK